MWWFQSVVVSVVCPVVCVSRLQVVVLLGGHLRVYCHVACVGEAPPSSVISGCKNKRIVRCFRGSSTCVSCRAITLPSPAGAPAIVGSDDSGVIFAQQKSGARPYDAVLSESLTC